MYLPFYYYIFLAKGLFYEAIREPGASCDARAKAGSMQFAGSHSEGVVCEQGGANPVVFVCVYG